MYCKADYPGFTTCKWTTYAQARAYVHVKTWERPKRAARALLMEAAAVINIRRSNNEEGRWIKSPPSLCMFVNNGREE